MAETEHFSTRELACRCCGRSGMDRAFLDRLERLRVTYGKPMVLTSAYRCSEHDGEVGGSGRHVTGRAVDVLVSGADAFALLALALGEGFICIGVSQRGALGGRFLHLDDLTAMDGFPSPRVWSYP